MNGCLGPGISVFMPLSTAQSLYAVGGMVSFVAVKVDDIAKIDDYILKKHGKTIVIVTHNIAIAKKAEMVIEIRDGRNV